MKYFELWEFDSPDKLGSGENMDKTFLKMLDKARGIANIPFRINSGYRTLIHNMEIHGKIDSAHLKGLAADISCVSDKDRPIMLKALRAVGFTRIGIAKTFIHVDIDKTKNQNRTWVY